MEVAKLQLQKQNHRQRIKQNITGKIGMKQRRDINYLNKAAEKRAGRIPKLIFFLSTYMIDFSLVISFISPVLGVA